MTLRRTLSTPSAQALAPRSARPAYAVPAWGKVRPSSIFGTPAAGGFGLPVHRGFSRREKVGLPRLTGRIERDGQDTRTYQRGSSGMVYAVV